jgi:hypothetical protein
MPMTRPQFSAAYALAKAFGHWWADACDLVVHGNRPDGGDSYSWAERVNAARADGTTAAAAWERYSRSPSEFVADLDATADEDTWACGGLHPPLAVGGMVAHRTGSHTLVWEIDRAGSVTLTARRRGSSAPHTYVLPDGTTHEGHAPGPDIWWRAIARDGQVTVTATEAAPEPESARWWDCEEAWCQSGGEYTWGILTCALRALGCTPPGLPPMQPRRYAPPRGGSRRMAGVT